MTNLHKCLLQILLNQSITVTVLLQWFKLSFSDVLFAVSKIALLIPLDFFCQIYEPYCWMLLKFSFWLFRVIKLLFSSFISSRFRTSLIFKIRFPSILIWFFMLLLAFLHFEVMVLFIIWSYSAFVCMQMFVVISAKVTVLYDDFKRMSSCIFS